MKFARLGIHPDRVRVALASDRLVQGMSPLHQFADQVRMFRLQAALESNPVGQPRMVNPRGIDGADRVHVELDHVQHDLQDRVDNRPAAGAAGDQHNAAVLGDDGRRLRTEHPLARFDQIRCRANRAVAVRASGFPVEIPHLVVQQEPAAANHDAGTEALFQRVRVGHRHSGLVDHREVRGLIAFRRKHDLSRRSQGLAAARLAAVDLLRQLPGVILVDEILRHCGEGRIGQIAGAVEVGQTHGLDHPVQRLGRPAALGAEIEVLQQVQHFDQHHAAAGRRRTQDLVPAKRAA